VLAEEALTPRQTTALSHQAAAARPRQITALTHQAAAARSETVTVPLSIYLWLVASWCSFFDAR